jgi:hypothetical protein
MAQQNINIGTTANDRTGDPLRTAGNKINQNFTEVYTTAQAAFNSGNTTNTLVQSNLIETLLIDNTDTHNTLNTNQILLCDPNSVGSNIVVNLSSQVNDGKTFTIKNINPGGYSVIVTIPSTSIENPVSKSFVSQVILANTGEVYTWVSYSGVYRHIG